MCIRIYLKKIKVKRIKNFEGQLSGPGLTGPRGRYSPYPPLDAHGYWDCFLAGHFVQIRFQLNRLFTSVQPHIELKFIARPSTRLLHVFSVNDRVSLRLRSHVYFFTCRSCEASYVGETCRHLLTRASEHIGLSPLTGKKRSNPSLTSILSHQQDTNHPVSFEDLKKLSSSSFEYELLLLESLLISILKPSLNAGIGLAPLLLF